MDYDERAWELANYVADQVGRTAYDRICVHVDNAAGIADIEIALRESGWEAQSRAIDGMLSVRSEYLGRLSINYSFVRRDGLGNESAPLDHVVLVP